MESMGRSSDRKDRLGEPVEEGKRQPEKDKCTKCLAEWEADKPETFLECVLKDSDECPINQAIAFRSFS